MLEEREARRLYITCMQIYATMYYTFSGKSPGLPPALEEAIKAQKKSAPPLLFVNPPAMAANSRRSSGAM